MPEIRIEDCNDAEGGYAAVIFDGKPSVTPRDVMIRRFDTQQNYLSENGWQSFEAHINPDEVAVGSNDVYVKLGPQVTQHLEYGERIEIELVDTGLKGVASWPEISSYTGGGGGRGRRMMSSQAKLREVFTPRPPPPSGPPADTTAVQGGAQATVIAPRQMFPPPPPPGTPPPPPPPLPPPPPAKKGKGWIHALALLVCLVLVFGASGLAWQYTSCGGVWITDLPNFVWSSIQGADRPQTCPFAPGVVAQVPPPPPPPPVSPPPPPVSPPPPPPVSPPPPPPVSPPPPPVSPPPPPVSPPPPPTTGQRSTPCPVPYQDACLDARAPPDLVADARDLFGQGSYDNGFTMIERAASRGYGPAMTAWAQLIDPATFQQGRGFTRPNPERAIELYTAAIAAGDTAAEPLRQALLQRLRTQAESGGQGAADARRILERFGRSP